MLSFSWQATPPVPSPARCCRSTDGSDARLRRYQLPKHRPKPNAPLACQRGGFAFRALAVIGAGKTDADPTPTEDRTFAIARLLGEHNEEILREAGLTNEDIAQLYSENVVVRDALLDTPAE